RCAIAPMATRRRAASLGRMDASDRPDVVVVGSGPAGRAAALEAARLGRRVALVERRGLVGGLCVHAGTIPSKALLAAALDAVAPRDAASELRRPTRLDLRALARPASSVVAAEHAALEAELRAAGVELVQGEASLLDGHRVAIDGERPRVLEAELVVLAP